MGILAAWPALAATPVDPDEELRRRQQRDEAQQQRLQPRPDVRLERPAEPGAAARLPDGESPCFVIERLDLDGDAADRFAWALEYAGHENDGPLDRCLGANGINLVMKRVQNAIVGAGYVTTRILAQPQDLNSGTLRLTVLPGRIRAIRAAAGTDPRATWWNAFPMAPGDLLNLRDIEQGLENMKRVPTAEADIQIAPAEGPDARPGDSDLVVAWTQAFPWRINLAADDSGSKATGRNQGSATVSLDHLLTLNDLFYVTTSQDLHGSHDEHGTRGTNAHYSLPFGYWQLAFNHGKSRYHQSVAGASQTYVYSGSSRNTDLRLTRLVHRDAASKTALGLRLWQRSSHNYIDDTEILVQRRRTAGWELNGNHKRFLAEATLDANLAWRRGTSAHESLAAPEDSLGEGDSHLKLIAADATWTQPFAWLDQRWRYTLAWRGQWNRGPLVPQDRFAIGGRYTARGFDGETMLSADRGRLVRNDLGLALPGGVEAYLGLDWGRVGGQSADRLIGRELIGGVFGLRGSYRSLGYDLFVGRPFKKPGGFVTAHTTSGFMLNLSY